MFCFRTLLVWGRSFGFHLLLGGEPLREKRERLRDAHARLARLGWKISLQASPWDWAATEFVFLDQLQPAEWVALVDRSTWIKLSITLPLAAFDTVPAVGAGHFLELARALC